MNNYHDYIFKDGKFVGLFEECYRDCDDPWDASKEEYAASLCSVAGTPSSFVGTTHARLAVTPHRTPARGSSSG